VKRRRSGRSLTSGSGIGTVLPTRARGAKGSSMGWVVPLPALSACHLFLSGGVSHSILAERSAPFTSCSRLPYVRVPTLEPVHPSTQPLYYLPNTIGTLVELTGHHEDLWVGHWTPVFRCFLITVLAGLVEVAEDREGGVRICRDRASSPPRHDPSGLLGVG